MRKYMNKTGWFSLAAVLLMTVLVSTAAASDADSYALLVQQSPAEAGSVTPGSGVHSVRIGDTVSLTATPKPGYRFLYWLGDVSAADAVSTSIQVDSPKMVVAVFTREAYEEELPGVNLIKGTAAGGGGGGGRMIGTPLSAPGSVNPGSYVDYPDYSVNYPNFDNDIIPVPNSNNDDIPVPDNDSDDVPVPNENGEQVPEPATVLLLGLGATALLKRKK